MKLWCSIVVCAFGMCAARAETYYLSVTGVADAFTDCTKWVNGSGAASAAWDSTATYVVSNGVPGVAATSSRVLSTPNAATTQTFAGGRLILDTSNKSQEVSLTLAVKSDSNAAEVSFPEGIYLGNYARIIASNGTVEHPNILNANLCTRWNDSGELCKIRPSASDQGLVLKGALAGDLTDAQYQITQFRADYYRFNVGILGDISDFAGCFDCVAFQNEANLLEHPDQYGLKVTFGNGMSPATIYPHSNDMLTDGVAIVFAVDSCDSIFRIANFGKRHNVKVDGKWVNRDYSIQSGMAFEFPVDGSSGKCGQFVVTDSVYSGNNCLSYATNVIIRLVGDPSSSDGVTTNKFATLSVPKTTPLSIANFRLECQVDPWIKPVLTLEENGDCLTFYVIVPPPERDIVTMVKSDVDTHKPKTTDSSAFTSGESWSSGMPPEDGHIYLMAGTNNELKIASTPYEGTSSTTAECVFPANSSLYLWQRARIQTQCASLTFNDLRSYEGVLGKDAKYGTKDTTGIYKGLLSAEVTTVDGNITIDSGYFSFGCFQGQTFIIPAKLHGAGTLAFSGMFVIDRDQSNYYLTGINDDFYGKITTRIAYRDNYRTAYEFGTWTKSGKTYYEGYQTLWIEDGRNLGADLATPTADALLLTDYVRLATTNAFTIAAKSNRGVTVDGNAVIQTDAGRSIRIETPLTINGNLYKEGAGILTLAGAATAASGVDTMVVTNGTLQLAGARAVAGLTLSFASGTKLAVDPDAFMGGDSGVLLDPSKIVLAPSFGGKLPLVNDSGVSKRETGHEDLDVPLFTVATAEKATLHAMLPSRPPKLYAHTQSVWNEPIDNPSTGLTTFSAHVSDVGIIIIVR